MATQLNLKDPVLIERARVLARRDGQPVTAKLRALVDREWEAQEAGIAKRRQALNELIGEVRAAMPEDVRSMTSKEIMDSIYDEGEPDGFAR